VAGGGDRIARPFRHRAVPARPQDFDREAVRRRQKRAVADADFSDLQSAVEVERKHTVDVRIFERAVVDHEPVSGAALFTRLEAEDDRARDLRPPAAQRLRRAEQDAHVAVVTAGVHHAGTLRPVGRVAALLDRQRIHVGAKQRHGTRPRAAQRCQHAGLADSGLQRIERQRTQALGDERRRIEFEHGQFGLRVQFAPHIDERFFHEHCA
jgi:hypothetical protein